MRVRFHTGVAAAVGRAALAALVLAGAAPAAQAHHSAAMFDSEHSLVLDGTVRDFQWESPHCWIQLVVPEAQGTAEWSIEMGAPLELMRLGWRKSTLKPGDKVMVTVHPLKDGGKGGRFVSAVAENGAPVAVARP